jgi:hypothetical protein
MLFYYTHDKLMFPNKINRNKFSSLSDEMAFAVKHGRRVAQQNGKSGIKGGSGDVEW